MKTARVHRSGGPFQVDEIPIPEPTGSDVLIEVKACGVVPNLGNVVKHWEEWFPHLPLPAYPASYGLDPSGVIAAGGADVVGLPVGQRVYVNPVRTCRVCKYCRTGQFVRCPAYTFAGYFGFGPSSRAVQDRYPWGGFAQYMIAPSDSLVYIPDNLSFELASRFGYLGTAYAGLRRGLTPSTSTLLINGATGTLGIGTTLVALALGVPRILAVARNRELLERIRGIDPQRIEVFSTLDGSTTDWARGRTDGMGVDLLVEALGPEASPAVTMAAFYAVSRGGNIVTIGGQKDNLPLNPIWLMASDINYMGSAWFTTAQGQEMAELVRTGALDLSGIGHRSFGLNEVNEAIDAAAHRDGGGFMQIAVTP